MEDFSRKLKQFDWKGLQKQAKKVQASTASALKDLVMTDLENKVRAATGDTNWGASGSDLAEIAQGTYNREDFTLIMSIIWQRLASTRWRCVYKALDVLKYLVLHGASKVLEETREALPHIRRLEHFSFVDQVTRRDEGANVRARASSFVQILTNDNILEDERSKSAALRAKIGVAVPSSHFNTNSSNGGLSSDDYRFGAASGRGGGGYDDMPPSRMTQNTSNFNGFGASTITSSQNQVSSTPTATVDDLLGGLEPVPALPAPESNNSSNIGFGLSELMGPDTSNSVPQNGFSNGTNNSAMAALYSTTSAVNTNTVVDEDDDDDDDFDPRAFSTGPPPPASSTNEAVPTSRLIANLAAARISENQNDTAATTPLSVMQAEAEEKAKTSTEKPKEDVAYGGLVHFENIMLDKTTRVESKPINVNVEPTPTNVPPATSVNVPGKTGVEVDPFGDLLSTAKKSGVL